MLSQVPLLQMIKADTDVDLKKADIDASYILFGYLQLTFINFYYLFRGWDQRWLGDLDEFCIVYVLKVGKRIAYNKKQKLTSLRNHLYRLPRSFLEIERK
jgi:hypothetical protein